MNPDPTLRSGAELAAENLETGDARAREDWLERKREEDFRLTLNQAVEAGLISIDRAAELAQVSDVDERKRISSELWGQISTVHNAAANIQEGVDYGVITQAEGDRILAIPDLDERASESQEVRRISKDYAIIERALSKNLIDEANAERLKDLSQNGEGFEEITNLISLRPQS